MSKPVGLVMAGAAARGAYEAGALAELLPALEARGERPTVLVGTSAGALNAAFLAGRAHLPADAATKALVEMWMQVERGDVFAYSPLGLAGLVSQELGLSKKPRGLVDTSALRATLDDAMGDWSQIGRNVAEGHLDALAIVTTAASTGHTVVFVEGGKGRRSKKALPAPDDKKGIEYVAPRGGMAVEHVMASAAIPVMFPPIDIGGEWFVDGGLRLNTPIKPAISLGVDRVAVVATDPARHRLPEKGEPVVVPDLDDFMLHFLQAALGDPLIEDMWRLAGINTLLDRGARRKRPIGYLFVGPARRGELGQAAAEVVAGMRPGEFRALSWLLGRQGNQHEELLSYLLFDPAFFEAAIELGRNDAKRELAALNRMETGWRTEPMRG